MQAILLVFTFLMLFAIQSTASYKIAFEEMALERFQRSVERVRYAERLALAQNALERAREKSPSDNPTSVDNEEDPLPKPPKPPKPKPTAEKGEEGKRSRRLNFDTLTPPTSSRLNLWWAVQEKGSDDYERAARLLRILYGKSELFQSHERIEYELLEGLHARRDKIGGMKSIDELATLVFDDPHLQTVFYQLMHGGYEMPSMMWFMVFEPSQDRKVNLLFAPKEVLGAYLNREKLCEEIERFREELLERLIYEEKNRKELDGKECLGRIDINNYLKNRCQALSGEYNLDLVRLFELGLSKPGPILYKIDSETGAYLRRRLN